MEEWTRLATPVLSQSSSTKHLESLQLLHFFAGLQWVSKRCNAVQLLVLNLGDPHVASMEQLLPLVTSLKGPSLRSLSELYLFHYSAATQRHPESQASAEIIQALMSQAAAMAPALRVVNCFLHDVVPGKVFPVMCQVEHLVLIVYNEAILPEIAAALPHMRRLQTVLMTGDLGFEMPSLNLVDCTNLHCIRLKNIAPAGLHLPSSCAVHLDLGSLEVACAPMWALLSSVGTLYLTLLSMVVPNNSLNPRNCEAVPWLSGAV